MAFVNKSEDEQRYLSENEKIQFSFFVNNYHKVLIIGWIVSILFVVLKNMYPFIIFSIILLLINGYILVKFEVILMRYSGMGALAEMWLGLHLNKETNPQKNKFNKFLGVTFIILGVLSTLVSLGVYLKIFV